MPRLGRKDRRKHERKLEELPVPVSAVALNLALRLLGRSRREIARRVDAALREQGCESRFPSQQLDELAAGRAKRGARDEERRELARVLGVVEEDLGQARLPRGRAAPAMEPLRRGGLEPEEEWERRCAERLKEWRSYGFDVTTVSPRIPRARGRLPRATGSLGRDRALEFAEAVAETARLLGPFGEGGTSPKVREVLVEQLERASNHAPHNDERVDTDKQLALALMKAVLVLGGEVIAELPRKLLGPVGPSSPDRAPRA